MCYQLIEAHSCGHSSEHKIPCEGEMDNGICNAKPEATHDSVKDVPSECRKCLDQKAEDDFLAEQMRKINEDPELAAPAPPKAAPPPGTFGPMKSCTRWLNCGHVSNPAELDIERESADDPEWLETPEKGSCHKCSEMPDSVLKEMRASGKLKGDDPWGVMKGPIEVAAGGSSRAGAGLGQYPAFNIPDDSDDERRVSRSPSPDQIPTLTRGKGKGRADRPEETYASRHGVPKPGSESEHEDDDDESAVHSGDEDSDKGLKLTKSKPPMYSDDDEDEDDHPARGRKPAKHVDGSSSRGSSSRSADAHGARRSSSSYSHSHASDDDDDKDIPDWSAPPPGGPPPPINARAGAELVGAAELAQLGLPPTHQMSRARYEILKARKAQEAGDHES